ncbi:putative ATP-grasp-modified RiPP [Saccharopolyspora sp. TS4A08]|uniref:ATP-grasp-modified RiPP n=1 Tax=Saccharopolyspora ipomoeae TaxID=3042027 RepID=A0ABT6PVH9_9PSEU|nr:putative ATP-grasp-modified RiPP [Saccharopolyspora sp. TS4A08]MDI2032011.1 putative ATP-grasp-modified RiPP [Saccharopolyspora sp. TS4A08]
MTAVLNDTFAKDPFAPHSGQFPLGRVNETEGNADVPSEPDVRPWNLRRMTPVEMPAATGTAGVYDPQKQYAVTADGAPVVAAEPSANSVSNLDGDEGASEDWTYDFAPDAPYQV